MRGINLAERGHIVNILPAKDVTGGATGDVFSMAKWSHATIILTIGVSAAAFTKIFLTCGTDYTPANAEDLPFRLYSEETALGDTLAAAELVALAGKTPSANDSIMYVIELDHTELPETKHFVQLRLTNGVNSVIAAAVAILTGGRYIQDQSATAII
jgi:hypothetical protein